MMHERIGVERSGKPLWCILSTSAGRTLILADALCAAGMVAWAPRQEETRYPARQGGIVRICRRSQLIERKVTVALAPGFVFVEADHVDALLADRAAVHDSPFPGFSIYRHGDAIPLVADDELARMRELEERAARRTRRSHRYIYPRGARVRTDQSAFLGLAGVVLECDGKLATVDLGGSHPVKIGAWLLRPDEVSTPPAMSRQDRQRVTSLEPVY